MLNKELWFLRFVENISQQNQLCSIKRIYFTTKWPILNGIKPTLDSYNKSNCFENLEIIATANANRNGDIFLAFYTAREIPLLFVFDPSFKRQCCARRHLPFQPTF